MSSNGQFGGTGETVRWDEDGNPTPSRKVKGRIPLPGGGEEPIYEGGPSAISRVFATWYLVGPGGLKMSDLCFVQNNIPNGPLQSETVQTTVTIDPGPQADAQFAQDQWKEINARVFAPEFQLALAIAAKIDGVLLPQIVVQERQR